MTHYKALVVLLLLASNQLLAQYNNLWIPPTLTGTTFNLEMNEGVSQIVATGNQTVTAGINGNIWGPTLIINKGDNVQMNVTNSLNEPTTLHWHGMHLPAVMDGGPHQVIPVGTVWQPYWTMNNNAGTYWYHPHLHETTMEQVNSGLGGLMIVKDAVESALPLPRTYGTDDIPLVVTDRAFTTQNQFTVEPYGDSAMVNFTLRAQQTVPAQVVRFRLLDAAIERSYNIGFSDNRTFYVIASDGGLLNAPVGVTRYQLNVGERIEILVNFTGQSGQSFDLKAYNASLAGNIPGGESFVNGPFGNALGHKDFNLLHFNVGAQTASPITTIPSTLTTNTLLTAASANITRQLTITDSSAATITGVTIIGPTAFVINHKLYNPSYNYYTVPLNNTEIWEIASTSILGHPFHIHDVEFNILSINGAAPPAAQAGWKDVVFVPAGQTVRFIAKFDDFADESHPFMYHCHILLHEDEGMMGQFIVKNTTIPLDLLSFTAQLDNKKTILNWSVTNQVNTQSCIVERSADGTKWSELVTIPTKNNGGVNKYSHTDASTLPRLNYYRIKILDNDGKFFYSPTRVVELVDETPEFKIYPNPVQNKLLFNFTDPSVEVYYMKIINQAGRVMYMLPRPQWQNGIDVSHFAAGVYYVQITDAKTKKIVTSKFVKK